MQVHIPPKSFPATVFDLPFSSSSIVENARQVVCRPENSGLMESSTEVDDKLLDSLEVHSEKENSNPVANSGHDKALEPEVEDTLNMSNPIFEALVEEMIICTGCEQGKSSSHIISFCCSC